VLNISWQHQANKQEDNVKSPHSLSKGERRALCHALCLCNNETENSLLLVWLQLGQLAILVLKNPIKKTYIDQSAQNIKMQM